MRVISDAPVGGAAPDAAPASARRRGLPSKLILLAGSLWLIWAVAGNVRTPLFILALVTLAWGAIVALDRAIDSDVMRRRAAGLSVAAVMMGLIGANLSGILGTVTGLPDSLYGQWPILLGITFYGLQVAGVASDVLTRDIRLPSLLDYLVFILLGFKFYSGPIERATDLDRVVNRVEPLTMDQAWEAFSWTLLGIFMKFVIANPLAELIHLDTTDPIATMAVAIVAELRIYFDFAGYSFIAYGLARAAGIELTINFRQPLYAPNIREFWYRWHASIGNWLRQYIYFPVRRAFADRQWPTSALAPAVFLVSAFWHGATLSFAIWGVTHAIVFVLFVRVLSKFRWSPLAAHSSLIALLIFVRLLYIDADAGRLMGKLADFASAGAWRSGLAALTAMSPGSLPARALFAVAMGMIFIALEGVSARRYGTTDYRLFRTLPAMAVILVLGLVLVYDSPRAIFVYARN